MTFIRIGLALLVCSIVVGCGDGNPTVRKEETPTEAAGGDLEKIQEAVKKAGYKEKVAAVLDSGDKDWWVVTLEPPGTAPDGTPPPGRPIPTRVQVNKKSMEVVKPEGSPSKRGGGSEMPTK